jgi:hypothetical protein
MNNGLGGNRGRFAWRPIPAKGEQERDRKVWSKLMLYKTRPAPPQVRTRCRNVRCAGKLKTPTEDRRRAFCCERCAEAHYATRCVVCESALSKKTKRRAVCSRSHCRHEWQRHRDRYFSGAATLLPEVGQNAEKSSTTSKLKNGAKPTRGYRIVAGPPCHEANLWAAPNAPAKVKRDPAFEAVQLIQRETWPIDFGGGYSFDDLPDLERRLREIIRKDELRRFRDGPPVEAPLPLGRRP